MGYASLEMGDYKCPSRALLRRGRQEGALFFWKPKQREMRKQKGYEGFYSWAGLGPTKRPGPTHETENGAYSNCELLFFWKAKTKDCISFL